ncbi:zinc finger domain containing protein [Plasmopara halstedii]|uniref:RING-type E3 ubiquitin transferase n=1 Tax=Plasmopara halstedii TaxID=4781 RepID=A0A0P1AJS5_PLAHL|nr:zinc finger domain containing protein [Plasmopara halstedii]CEG41141.1 zinc finger domain containing protein [Plasmopara halstedii]|eukprot:XP_024577510.1 zinc finger domain containing protein [Plasmopara halstedii]
MEQGPPQNPYTFTREDYDNLVAKMPNCQISKRSKYEEIELVDDCTLFEIYRQPRAPITDPNATRTLSIRQLNADLTCPICLGIIKMAMVVMECLHRFCSDCISTAIRQSKRECPSCRIHIPSKRSLRPDTNFDALICKIYPNLAEFERNEDQIIEQINRSRHFNNAYTESTRMGVLSQAATRRQGRKKVEDTTSSLSSRPSSPSSIASLPVGDKRSSSDNSSTSATVSEEESARKKLKVAPSTSKPIDTITDRVHFRVLLHSEAQSNSPKLERTLFTTSARLKIRHLKKHLASLLKLDKYDNMCIVLPNVNCTLSGLSESVKHKKSVAIRKDLLCDQELEDFVLLKDIYEQYGMGMAWELRLLYHFSPGTIVNGIAQFVSASAKST